jgi:exonuclease III
MNRELQVVAWNVQGFGDLHRVITVKNWLRRLYPNTDIVCLQELQANSSLVEMHLRNLIPNGTVELDATAEGRTGSAIVVAPNVQVLDKGHKGDDTFAWVRIRTSTGPMNIGSVYAPAERGRRMHFWR